MAGSTGPPLPPAQMGQDEPEPQQQQYHHQQQQYHQQHHHQQQHQRNTSDEDSNNEKRSAPSLDTFNTTLQPVDTNQHDPNLLSPISQRAETSRLDDDLELLRAERLISREDDQVRLSRSKNRSHNPEPEDAFNSVAVGQVPEKDKNTSATAYKFVQFLKKFPRFVRYTVYLFPGATILLIPVLLGYFVWNDDQKAVGGLGGTKVMWFGIWLEIVWCSLWLSRMVTSLMPPVFQGIAKTFGSTTPKKWRDIGQQLELHTAVFLWFLAVLISFKPTCDGHRTENSVPKDRRDEIDMKWIDIMQKIIIAFFVLATLNWVEKIVIQWIATTFHQRTYATRIDNNKADISQIVHLFEYAKSHLENTDAFWQGGSVDGTMSGTQTPMRALQDNARQVWGKVGLVANRMGNDIIGRKVNNPNHPRRIVAELLRNTRSAQTLARLLFRSLIRNERDTVYLDDMQVAFATEDEAQAAFGVFDKDMNGDISLEEFEAVCNEIHLEKKAIAASLKDLDSVIQKLDRVFLCIIVIIAAIVFVSIFSSSAAAALASAGSAILGISWMLQATAQEFLQSIIFVFIKHPFDVGDRVTIYGSTGANMTGDDYYVTEVSLLYTEFKKMEGHIVQAPNSLLNTLFILNQRRSNGLADVVTLKIRFGTPGWMIEELKARMLEFILEHKRDYQTKIISEMTAVDECRSTSVNIIFFHKSSFQNELLRLTRHNNFLIELQQQMVAVGIQAPLRIEPGGSREYPMYWAGMQPPPYGKDGKDGKDGNEGYGKESFHDNYTNPVPPTSGLKHTPSTSSARDRVIPTISASIGDFQDVYEQRKETTHVQRLASIREKEVASQGEAEAEARNSTSALAPTSSVGSNSQVRSRIFGRGRSLSKSQSQREAV